MANEMKWKPCPFCGGQELEIETEEQFDRIDTCLNLRCETCKLDLWVFDLDRSKTYSYLLHELNEKWNRRAES